MVHMAGQLTATIRIRLDPAIRAVVESAAREQRRSVSQVVRMAVETAIEAGWLKLHEGQTAGGDVKRVDAGSAADVGSKPVRSRLRVSGQSAARAVVSDGGEEDLRREVPGVGKAQPEAKGFWEAVEAAKAEAPGKGQKKTAAVKPAVVEEDTPF